MLCCCCVPGLENNQANQSLVEGIARKMTTKMLPGKNADICSCTTILPNIDRPFIAEQLLTHSAGVSTCVEALNTAL